MNRGARNREGVASGVAPTCVALLVVLAGVPTAVATAGDPLDGADRPVVAVDGDAAADPNHPVGHLGDTGEMGSGDPIRVIVEIERVEPRNVSGGPLVGSSSGDAWFDSLAAGDVGDPFAEPVLVWGVDHGDHGKQEPFWTAETPPSEFVISGATVSEIWFIDPDDRTVYTHVECAPMNPLTTTVSVNEDDSAPWAEGIGTVVGIVAGLVATFLSGGNPGVGAGAGIAAGAGAVGALTGWLADERDLEQFGQAQHTFQQPGFRSIDTREGDLGATVGVSVRTEPVPEGEYDGACGEPASADRRVGILLPHHEGTAVLAQSATASVIGTTASIPAGDEVAVTLAALDASGFSTTQDVLVSDEGAFAAEFDLSEVPVGTGLEVSVSHDGDVLATETPAVTELVEPGTRELPITDANAALSTTSDVSGEAAVYQVAWNSTVGERVEVDRLHVGLDSTGWGLGPLLEANELEVSVGGERVPVEVIGVRERELNNDAQVDLELVAGVGPLEVAPGDRVTVDLGNESSTGRVVNPPDARRYFVGVAVGASDGTNTTLRERAVGSVTVRPRTAFAVSNLTAPGNATAGDTVTVTADVTNVGVDAGQRTVEFRFDGAVLETRNVSLEAGAKREVAFALETDAVAPGTYTHGVFTPDGSQTVTLRVGRATPITTARTVEETRVPPGASVQVTTTVTMGDAGGPLTVAERVAPAAQAVAIDNVTADGVETEPLAQAADPTGAVVELDRVAAGGVVELRYTLTVSETVGTDHVVSGEVTSGDERVQVGEATTVAVRASLDAVAARYDGDGDDAISIGELGAAAADYVRGALGISDLGAVAAAYVRGQPSG